MWKSLFVMMAFCVYDLRDFVKAAKSFSGFRFGTNSEPTLVTSIY